MIKELLSGAVSKVLPFKAYLIAGGVLVVSLFIGWQYITINSLEFKVEHQKTIIAQKEQMIIVLNHNNGILKRAIEDQNKAVDELKAAGDKSAAILQSAMESLQNISKQNKARAVELSKRNIPNTCDGAYSDLESYIKEMGSRWKK